MLGKVLRRCAKACGKSGRDLPHSLRCSQRRWSKAFGKGLGFSRQLHAAGSVWEPHTLQYGAEELASSSPGAMSRGMECEHSAAGGHLPAHGN